MCKIFSIGNKNTPTYQETDLHSLTSFTTRELRITNSNKHALETAAKLSILILLDNTIGTSGSEIF